MQWTWLCLLAGGLGAFLSYWYRLDTFYIVLYGGGSVLLAMITMLFDNGVTGGWREQLQAALQDYLENVMYPRMARSMSGEGSQRDKTAQERSGLRGVRTVGKREEPRLQQTQNRRFQAAMHFPERLQSEQSLKGRWKQRERGKRSCLEAGRQRLWLQRV